MQCGKEKPVQASRDFALQIKGYGLTTAAIIYRLPDHPSILQEFVWQEYDIAPKFPELTRFLDFWKSSIEGRLHEVRVAHKALIGPADLQFVTTEFKLH